MKKWSLILGCLLVAVISFTTVSLYGKVSNENTGKSEKTIAYDEGGGPVIKPTSISTTV